MDRPSRFACLYSNQVPAWNGHCNSATITIFPEALSSACVCVCACVRACVRACVCVRGLQGFYCDINN